MLPQTVRDIEGVFLVDKPAGMTSYGVIEQLKRMLKHHYGCTRHELPKIGHGGTLDPFATGLLIICIGKATKQSSQFLGCAKTYAGTIQFGVARDTADPTGTVIATSETVPAGIAAIQAAADQFAAAPYLQTPPMYSAKKKDGKRLYELAREGKTIERQPKACRITGFTINAYAAPTAQFEVTVSAGTYVRTLAEDLATKLGTVAHLTSLRRTACGAKLLCDATTPEGLFICS